MASKPDNSSSVEARRKERLALALRENLKRRKAQVRGRREDKPESPEPARPNRG